MSGLNITCDRRGKFWRVAVWQGRELRDLYVDKITDPDRTGAIVGGKAVRVLSGQKAAWFDCGLSEKVFIDNPGAVATGDYKTIQIINTARRGKAWAGCFVEYKTAVGKIGALMAPPRPWQRAIADLKNAKINSILFANREDHQQCKEWLETDEPSGLPLLKPLSKEPVHPALDEIIDELQESAVALPGGGNLVIEPTEALVAIDVNGGEAANPLAVNLQAVREIARRIRLRNMAGIIVIDALKMKNRTDKAKVLNALDKAVANDPAGVQVFGLTKLGLIELTRSRRGPSLRAIAEGS